MNRTATDETFVAFVRQRGRALARTATLIAGDPVAGEDLLQTTLANVYTRWHRGDIESPEEYVRTALVRTHISWRRRLMSTERPVGSAILDDASDPDIADRMVERGVLLDALAQLAPKQRAALVLRFFDDLSEADTAKALGCSAGSVKQHTTRGLAKLRTLLPEEAVRGLV